MIMEKYEFENKMNELLSASKDMEEFCYNLYKLNEQILEDSEVCIRADLEEKIAEELEDKIREELEEDFRDEITEELEIEIKAVLQDEMRKEFEKILNKYL